MVEVKLWRMFYLVEGLFSMEPTPSSFMMASSKLGSILRMNNCSMALILVISRAKPGAALHRDRVVWPLIGNISSSLYNRSDHSTL